MPQNSSINKILDGICLVDNWPLKPDKFIRVKIKKAEEDKNWIEKWSKYNAVFYDSEYLRIRALTELEVFMLKESNTDKSLWANIYDH